MKNRKHSCLLSFFTFVFTCHTSFPSAASKLFCSPHMLLLQNDSLLQAPHSLQFTPHSSHWSKANPFSPTLLVLIVSLPYYSSPKSTSKPPELQELITTELHFLGLSSMFKATHIPEPTLKTVTTLLIGTCSSTSVHIFCSCLLIAEVEEQVVIDENKGDTSAKE